MTSLSPAAALIARVKAILADRSDSRVAQLVAGKVFLVRVASAMLALVSQVLLARWMAVRVRPLHLCVYLGADDRRVVRRRSVVGGAAFHP